MTADGGPMTADGGPLFQRTADLMLATDCYLASNNLELGTDLEGGKHGRIRKKIEGKNDRQEYD